MSNMAQDELEYIRDLAQSGARAPLLGGRYLVWWGAMVTIAYTLHHLMVTGAFGLKSDYIPWMWMGFIGVGMGGFFTLLALSPKGKPGSGSMGNRVDRVVWMISGFTIFAFFMGAIAGDIIFGNPTISPNASLPLVFAVYAVCLVTTGTLGANTALTAAGYASLLFVAAAVAMQDSSYLYIVGAAGAFVTVLLPGIALMRNEPKTIV